MTRLATDDDIRRVYRETIDQLYAFTSRRCDGDRELAEDITQETWLRELATNRRGTHLYVANEAGYLNDIDLMTGVSATPIPLEGGGFGLGVTPDDGQAYVTIPYAGVVQVFSLQNRQLTRTIAVGGNPRRVAFSQTGRIGAITNLNGYITFVR